MTSSTVTILPFSQPMAGHPLVTLSRVPTGRREATSGLRVEVVLLEEEEEVLMVPRYVPRSLRSTRVSTFPPFESQRSM